MSASGVQEVTGGFDLVWTVLTDRDFALKLPLQGICVPFRHRGRMPVPVLI